LVFGVDCWCCCNFILLIVVRHIHHTSSWFTTYWPPTPNHTIQHHTAGLSLRLNNRYQLPPILIHTTYSSYRIE
jgi:hypothetical protein